MSKIVIAVSVPKDKCPLDVLAQMGERIRNSWIYLHENAYLHLLNSEGAKIHPPSYTGNHLETLIEFEATQDYPETAIVCIVPSSSGFGKVTEIFSEDIAYRFPPTVPEKYYYLKMEE